MRTEGGRTGRRGGRLGRRLRKACCVLLCVQCLCCVYLVVLLFVVVCFGSLFVFVGFEKKRVTVEREQVKGASALFRTNPLPPPHTHNTHYDDW